MKGGNYAGRLVSRPPRPVLDKEGGRALFPLLSEEGMKGWWKYAMWLVRMNHSPLAPEKQDADAGAFAMPGFSWGIDVSPYEYAGAIRTYRHSYRPLFDPAVRAPFASAQLAPHV